MDFYRDGGCIGRLKIAALVGGRRRKASQWNLGLHQSFCNLSSSLFPSSLLETVLVVCCLLTAKVSPCALRWRNLIQEHFRQSATGRGSRKRQIYQRGVGLSPQCPRGRASAGLKASSSQNGSDVALMIGPENFIPARPGD